MSKFKLVVERHVDPDGDGGYILNLPKGYRFFDEDAHVRGFDSMKDLRISARNEVVYCEGVCCGGKEKS